MTNTMSSSIRYLPASVLEKLHLSAEEVVGCIEHLLIEQVAHRAWNAPKSVIMPPDDGRYLMATLAAADDPPFLVTKSLVLNPENPKKGLGTIHSLVTLLDSHTGIPLAVMDGNWVTAIRTAGLSAVAARRLARPDASVAAFIGCGVQAHSHLRMFAGLFPLKEVRVYGRGTNSRDAFCRASQAMGLRTVICQTAQEAVTEASLVVTSVMISPGLQPFLDARWLSPGVFVTMVDLAASWIPDTLKTLDQVIIDDLQQEASMEKPLVDPAWVHGDLCGLVNGSVAARTSGQQKIAFAFRGLAMGDLALAGLAYQRASALSAGMLITDA